ncbi:MAG: molecular chaperone DnaK [Planctomycetota bacterium]|jgi:molecular chaperone DnaK
MAFFELNVLNNAQEPILGIDLGTTNSLVAMWRDGRPQILKPEGHSGQIPSALYFPENGEQPIVGQAVRERALVDPKGTVFSIKRFMGRGLKDVKDELSSVQFPATENENGLIEFDIRGRMYTPQELSALILMRVHDVACKTLEGHPGTRVVITVPAYFDDTQRQATRDAARLAGLQVERIINEPTAASLAFGLDQKKEGNIAVYDLGGGTFDISILTIEDGVFRVLATAGDTHLGGDDFDRALSKIAHDDLLPDVGEETAADPAFRQALQLSAERTKIALSQHLEAELRIIIPDSNVRYHREIKRSEFDALGADLIEKTLHSCRRAMTDAGLEAKDIDEVVLVGGSTRIPAVRVAVEKFFGRKPHMELNPDEVVALGAAVQGHILSGGTRDILLMDVVSLSLGLETVGGGVDKVIVRNSPMPCQATETYTTNVDNQTGIKFTVIQGERELSGDCRTLGKFELNGIPPMPAGLPRVAVRFQVDANGMLSVTAKEQSTGISANIVITPMHGLTDDEVEGMLKASYDHAQADFDNRRAADLRVDIARMCRASRAHYESAKPKLDRETIEDIDAALKIGDEAEKSNAPDDLQKVRDEIERATMPLAAVLMDAVAKSAMAGKTLDEL